MGCEEQGGGPGGLWLRRPVAAQLQQQQQLAVVVCCLLLHPLQHGGRTVERWVLPRKGAPALRRRRRRCCRKLLRRVVHLALHGLGLRLWLLLRRPSHALLLPAGLLLRRRTRPKRSRGGRRLRLLPLYHGLRRVRNAGALTRQRDRRSHFV